jgi:ribosomal protein S18 acetylase RimI-like enzyme
MRQIHRLWLMARRRTTHPQLRAATMSDIKSLVRLENRVFASYYKAHRFDDADFRYYLRSPRTIALVATQGDDVVGYVLGIVHTGRLRHLARLYSLAVASHFRRHRAGTRLMQAFLRAAKKRRCKRILLEIAVVNTGGLHFFSALGFKKRRELKNYYGQGIDGIRMGLEL